MTFAEWLKDRPRGTLRKIELRTGLSYVTLLAARGGRPAKGRTAQLISEFTGGAVSVEELVCPPAKADGAGAHS